MRAKREYLGFPQLIASDCTQQLQHSHQLPPSHPDRWQEEQILQLQPKHVLK
jgi:hypothetical protein